MKSVFPLFIAFSLLLWEWTVSAARVEEDLVAKAQNEREVVVYGTALAAQRLAH